MAHLSIPVPPGFTISTEVCGYWLEHGSLPAGLEPEIDEGIAWLEEVTGRRLGDPANPLLVSIRSGAPVSMPGMMDTVLNVGLNSACVAGLAARGGSRGFALDSYRRLIQMFGTIVLGIPRRKFDDALDVACRVAGGAAAGEYGAENGSGNSSDLPEKALEEVVRAFKEVAALPEDPREQMAMAIRAVFQSWKSDRAEHYRRLNHIADTPGTAVTIQAMIFGNCGAQSGTGVGFTRNPSTGARELFGEFLPNAQGEDIVAGIRTPIAIGELAREMPGVFRRLQAVAGQLERHFRDVEDFEFTIENGALFLLQTRSAKRAALAAVRSAVDMEAEGLISRLEALKRVEPAAVPEILSPQLDAPAGSSAALAKGLAASPGAAVGRIALSADEAVEMAASGDDVILVTEETTANDIHGMAAARGLLTARGGATSHAAVVARGMGKCCVTGAKGIWRGEEPDTVSIGGKSFHTGDWISLDGATGMVFEGKLPVRPADAENPYLDKLLAWAAESGPMGVRANADTPADAAVARAAGAQGIGLCRTEHMFFAEDRLGFMRSMILAETAEERVRALDLLLPMQRQDFEELYRTMSPLPVTIRLLDPPLHEFLPPFEEIKLELDSARRDEDWDLALELEKIRHRAGDLKETNPMMGHRGCRLSLSHPEILEMQVTAILEAALAASEDGLNPAPEIMVPLVASEEEIKVLVKMIHRTAGRVFAKAGGSIPYAVGAMIELPRAAACADSIARHVSFLSFGTNDLTQMTFGFSRDDARSYLDGYLRQGILKADPFVTIDREGVGCLMELAIRSARAANPGIKIGVCGEHGGDPDSIAYFADLGIDYISCSPYRLRMALLACGKAQASRPVLRRPAAAATESRGIREPLAAIQPARVY